MTDAFAYPYSGVTNYEVPPGPFVGTQLQTHRMRAQIQVIVGGIDVTDRLNPFLISVRVMNGAGVQYQCEMELDDRDARLPIPPLSTPVYVLMGWTTETLAHVFRGVVADVEHGFHRKQGGRRMWIRCTGADFLTSIKNPIQMHLGDGAPPGQDQGTQHSLSDFLNKAAQAFGATIDTHSFFSSIKRDYWSINNESFIHLLQRAADEHGAVWQIASGNQAFFTVPGAYPNGATTHIYGIWGENLIGWRVRPFVARSTWGQASQQYYQDRLGIWGQVLGNLLKGAGVYALPAPAPNEQVAQQQNDGAQWAGGQSGAGRVIINGEPAATMNSVLTIKGARPGVDGQWDVVMAEHVWSREGYVTFLDVYPKFVGQAIVGKDAQGNPIMGPQLQNPVPFSDYYKTVREQQAAAGAVDESGGGGGQQQGNAWQPTPEQQQEIVGGVMQFPD